MNKSRDTPGKITYFCVLWRQENCRYFALKMEREKLILFLSFIASMIAVKAQHYVAPHDSIGIHAEKSDVSSSPLYSDTPGSYATGGDLGSSVLSLHEVVVTAQEARSSTSASIIDSMAMKHLQPSSFSDLLELVPGNISTDPDMGAVNDIRLREARNITHTDDYATSALGTSFVIDGVPVNTSAHMQTTPDSNRGGRIAVGKGVDMRTIATDDIERVELVRGIPSVEYGELTSGLVKIKRKSGVSRLEARFKADTQSQLFYLGKGIRMPGSDWTMNVGVSYLDSKIDPRNNRENFRRITSSVRSNKRWDSETVQVMWNSSVNYSLVRERDDSDPDLTVNNTIDAYRSTNHSLSWNNTLDISPVERRFLRKLSFTGGVNYGYEHLSQQKHVSSQRVMPIPNSLTPGSNYVGYLPLLYLADHDVYGKPFTAFTKLSASMRTTAGPVGVGVLAGAEWNMSKNYGRGEVYDLDRPLSSGNTSRPRAFSDIPALNQVSAYAEAQLRYEFAGQRVNASLGVRETQLVGLGGRYALDRHPYLDPRINLVWTPASTEVAGYPIIWEAGAGFGRHTKMPVAAYLFPDPLYSDLVQLNYYHNNPDYRALNVMTYIEDMTNYDLKAAVNDKWEIRGDASYRGNRLSVTYFREDMSNGFRHSGEVRRYVYNKYDASAFSPEQAGGAPAIDELPYTPVCLQLVRTKVTNGSRTLKSGVEYTFQSSRWKRIGTRVTINGAYLETTLNNSQALWYKPSVIVNNRELQYIGLYDDTDGSVYRSFNTNFLFDTDVPRINLNVSLGIQNMWFTSRRTLMRTGRPTHYLDEEGALHPFTDESARDPYLAQLIRNYASSIFTEQKIPVATTFNIKATKTFWHERVAMAMYVNRLFSIMPDYERYGVTIRRSTAPYFGMEINFRI